MSYLRNMNRAVLNFNSTGDNTIITNSTTSPIIIWKINFTATAATNVTMKDSSAGAVSGAYDLQANGSLFFAYDGEPYWYITPGNNFVINQSGTASIQGNVYYTYAV